MQSLYYRVSAAKHPFSFIGIRGEAAYTVGTCVESSELEKKDVLCDILAKSFLFSRLLSLLSFRFNAVAFFKRSFLFFCLFFPAATMRSADVEVAGDKGCNR